MVLASEIAGGHTSDLVAGQTRRADQHQFLIPRHSSLVLPTTKTVGAREIARRLSHSEQYLVPVTADSAGEVIFCAFWEARKFAHEKYVGFRFDSFFANL